MAAAANAIKTIVGSLRQQDLSNAASAPIPSKEDKLDRDESWGPKTTAVPEDPLPDMDVNTLVNWGPDIPPEAWPQLEEVLRNNAAGFGMGGCLGHIDTKVPIPLKPDTQPISMPIYGASPAKHKVIDKQMDAWFEAEVIEPSVSPWGESINGRKNLVSARFAGHAPQPATPCIPSLPSTFAVDADDQASPTILTSRETGRKHHY
ncbi:hypothetical protein C8J57DRAFT_1530247 [Mycena rebaudengoi]|nr:hypothetical protein C8J57DRAFT_1530247 [Mycena rebaudengoi]